LKAGLSRGRTRTSGHGRGHGCGQWPLGRPWLWRTIASTKSYCVGKSSYPPRRKHPSVRMPAPIRTDADFVRTDVVLVGTDAPLGPPWILRELHKVYSNVLFSLPRSPQPGKAIVCLVHFVVWVTIGKSYFVHTCRCFVELFCSSLVCKVNFKVVAAMTLRPQWQGIKLAIGYLGI
jgi:hypothetical protein